MQPQQRVISSGGGYTQQSYGGRPVYQQAQMGSPMMQGQPMRSTVGMAPANSTRVLQAGQPSTTPLQYRPATTPQVISASGQPYTANQSYISASPRVGQVSMQGQPVRMAMQAPIRTAPVVQAVRTTAPNLGPTYTQQAYEDKHKDDPQLTNLKELRKTSGLKEVPVKDGLISFHEAGGAEATLTREQFLAAYTALLTKNGITAPADSVQNAVFDLFDRDDNGIVDMMELICGISLLCAGSEDDKIHAVFDIFDVNGDGFISMDEMYKFLTSVFKVVLTPNVMGVMNSMGVTVESAEDLASVTALECFKTADLNHDGKLSVVEFKNWFYAPRNDPSFLFSPVRKLLN